MLGIEEFQKLNHPETIAITRHGKDRMIERNITVNEIIGVIDNGEIIRQYEDDKPLPSCLILGKGKSGRPIHIVVSHDDEFIYLITAYHPDPSLWNEDLRTKKE